MTPILTQHDCADELRNVNLKVTPARLGVLAAIESTTKPLDVAAITKFLERNEISADRVTVFRIINALTNKGLIAPIQFQEGKFRYEHSGREDHHHFICENCGTVEDISDCNIDAIEKNIKKKKGLLVKRHSLEFFGLCQTCQNI